MEISKIEVAEGDPVEINGHIALILAWLVKTKHGGMVKLPTYAEAIAETKDLHLRMDSEGPDGPYVTTWQENPKQPN